MTRIVCLVCDRDKRPDYQNKHPNARRVSWCDYCVRDTDDRAVGADYQHIAPDSTLTFKQQRALFEQQRRPA